MNSTAEWISRSVSRLRAAAPVADKEGAKGAEKLARASTDKSGVTDVVPKVAAPRSTHERLRPPCAGGKKPCRPARCAACTQTCKPWWPRR